MHFEVKYLPCGPVSSLLVNTTCFPMTSVGVLGGCALQKVCGVCEAGKMLTEDALAQWRGSNFFPASFDARVGHRFTQKPQNSLWMTSIFCQHGADELHNGVHHSTVTNYRSTQRRRKSSPVPRILGWRQSWVLEVSLEELSPSARNSSGL